MSQEWPRIALGKLVKSVGGEIVGKDFTTTGRTDVPPFPKVTQAVQNEAVGISGQLTWADYPHGWAEHGAILFRPAATSDGRPWYLVTRYRPCEERPGQPGTPVYVSSMTAAVEPKELDFPTLFQLRTRLDTQEFTAVDGRLPPLAVADATPVPLPPDWFGRVRPMLVSLASGLPVARSEADTAVDGFIDLALWAVACLPGAIRWRVPVAAGVYAVPTREQAQVLYAVSLSHRSRATGTADTGVGEAYAEWFAAASGGGAACETVQDVLALVRGEFPKLDAWDAIPPADDWRKAVNAIAELGVLKAVQDWAANPSGKPPPLDSIDRFRPAVLALAERKLAGPQVVREHLLAGVTNDQWKGAWQEYARDHADSPLTRLGELVGPLPFNPHSLGLGLRAVGELSASLTDKANKRLSAAFPKDLGDGVAAWGGVVRQAFATPPPPGWFAAWATGNAALLAWAAAALRLNLAEVSPTDEWAAGSPLVAAAMKAVLESRAPAGGFDDLFKLAKGHQKLAAKVVEHAEPFAPEHAYRLAVEVGHKKWIDERLQSPSPSSGWLDLAVKRCVAGDTDKRWAAQVVKNWDRVTTQPTARNALLTQLVGRTANLSDWWTPSRPREQPPVVFTRLSELVGQPTFTPDTLEWVLAEPTDLPEAVKPVVRQKLKAAFDGVSEGGFRVWEGVVRRAFAPTPHGWFADWAKANTVRMAWAAASVQLLSDATDPTAEWRAGTVPAAAAAMQSLLRRKRPAGEWADVRAQAKAFKGVARALVKHVEKVDFPLACQLASVSDNDDSLHDSLSSSNQLLDVYAEQVSAAGNPSENSLAYLLKHWDLLNAPRREELRRVFRPHLGVAERVLADAADSPAVTDKVADWVWPILKKLVEGNTKRRRQVLRLAAESPLAVQKMPQFVSELLNPVLSAPDIRELSTAGGPVLQFALDVRDGKAREFPEVTLNEAWSAWLWRAVLPRRPATAPTLPLRTPEQLPVALCFAGHVGHTDGDAAFWKRWFAFLAQPVPSLYSTLLQQANMLDEPLWRFARGWETVKNLQPREMQVIREHDLKYDFWAALNAGGTAHPPPVEFFTDPVAAAQFCPDAARWQDLFKKALPTNDEVLIGILWMHCLALLSGEEVKEMVLVLNPTLLKKHKERAGVAYTTWFRAAKTVIETDAHIKEHKPAMTRRVQRML